MDSRKPTRSLPRRRLYNWQKISVALRALEVRELVKEAVLAGNIDRARRLQRAEDRLRRCFRQAVSR